MFGSEVIIVLRVLRLVYWIQLLSATVSYSRCTNKNVHCSHLPPFSNIRIWESHLFRVSAVSAHSDKQTDPRVKDCFEGNF